MAHLLPRAIESAAKQQHAPVEIIVVDDGSKDRTPAVLTELSKSYPSLRFVTQKNQGNAGAKNTGIRIAAGKWLAFLDADDVWLPNRLSSQIKLLRKNSKLKWAAGAYYAVSYKDDAPVICGKPEVEARTLASGDTSHSALELIASPTSVWIGTVIAESAAIRSLNGFCEDLLGCDDSELWVRMALHNKEIGFVVEPVARYTVAQQGSLTGMASKEISPSQYLHYERLMTYKSSTTEKGAKTLLKKILQAKIDAYMRCLVRTGSLGQAKEFTSELAKRSLPLPNWKLRLVSRSPEFLVLGLKTSILKVR
jgi:glycosyltransferase involved in cell wall biosynthesis